MVRLARAPRIASVVVLAAFVLGGAATARQVVPTGAATQDSRTGMIVGQVVDETGAPVPEAIVQMTMPASFNDPTSPRGRVMTDGEGRYFFADLPRGEFWLQASKDGYVSGGYRQRRPSGAAQRLTLASAERRVDVTLTLWKYAVIAGSVVDEAGEPVVGVGVRALVRHMVGGRLRFGSWLNLGPTAVTDDRGVFRMAAVQPGTYAVVVPSTQITLPVAMLDAAAEDASVRSDLFFGGIMETAPLGTKGIQQVGDAVLLTMTRVLILPPSSDGRMQAYPTTYFPASSTAAAATPITLQSGEERTDVAITMRPLPAARVSGRLITPDGSRPRPIALRLLGAGAADVWDDGLLSGSGAMIPGMAAANAMSDADGRFTILGVPQGEYVLSEANRFLIREVQAGRTPYWIAESISVGTNDITDLAVQLRPAIRVEGRVQFESASGGPAPSVPPILANGAVVFETPSGEPGRFAAPGVRGESGFATVAPAGRYIVDAVETGGWFVSSVTLDGKDVTDRVIDLQTDATTFVVSYTSQPTRVTGTVKNDRGEASADAIVLAFPIDPARWVGYGPDPRTLKSRPASPEGTYAFDNLPPGEYCLIAIDDAKSDDWQDPKRLEAMASQATRLTIESGNVAAKTLDLTLKVIR